MSEMQITLPNAKCIFKFLKLDDNEKIRAIEMGISAVQLVNEKRMRNENIEFNDKLNEKDAKYQAIIKTMKTELNKKEQEKLILKQNHLLEKNDLHETIKDNMELQYKQVILEKDNRIEHLSDTLGKERVQIFEMKEAQINSERALMKDMQKEYQKQLDSIRLHYEEKLEKYMVITNKGEENSSVKGKISENVMFNDLNMLFPENQIEDTHNEPGRGDFIMTNKESNKFMLENKDYAKNVPKKEIEKFKRDLENNCDICAGILMSNASGICNKPDFHIEPVGKKIAIYLHKTNKDVSKIRNAVDIISAIMRANIDFSNVEIRNKLSQNSSEIKRKISKARKDLDKFHNSMVDNILDIENLTKKTYSDIKIKY
tara:strand:- start:63 stop:1178 length:1116 start_codon:yes stop_codon:yes gene_type:complete